MKPWHLLTTVVIVKGVLISAVLAVVREAVGSTFVQNVVIAAVSASLSGAFVLIAAYIARPHARKIESQLDTVEQHAEDIKGALNANQSRTDSSSS